MKKIDWLGEIDCNLDQRLFEDFDNEGKSCGTRSEIPYIKLKYKAVVEIMERVMGESDDWRQVSMHESEPVSSARRANVMLAGMIPEYCTQLSKTEHISGKRRKFVACIKAVLEIVTDHLRSDTMTIENFEKNHYIKYDVSSNGYAIDITRTEY